MEKKYTFNDQSPEDNEVREPAVAYNSLFDRKAKFIDLINNMSFQEFEHLETLFYTDRYVGNIIPSTAELMQEQAKRAIEDVKAGRVIDHEELKKRFR